MNYLHCLWDFVPFGILVFSKGEKDQPDTCVYGNNKAVEWLSISNVKHKTWTEIFPFDFAAHEIPFYKDTSQKWLQMSVKDTHPVNEKDYPDLQNVWVVTLSDITALQKATEIQDNKQKTLERSNKDLEHFAYVASHDLREPLRKISAFAERLNAKYGDKLEGDGTLYLKRMTDAALRMQNLIDDLLAFSRVTRHSTDVESADLNDIIRLALADLEKSNASITLDKLPIIKANPIQMTQLFQNLLSNAIKFRKKDTLPKITVTYQQTPSEHQITIQDNGIGFEETDAERIFEIFQRLNGRSEYNGTGIGLAICKKIVENHNGTIHAISRPDEGATFTITLPNTQAQTTN